MNKDWRAFSKNLKVFPKVWDPWWVCKVKTLFHKNSKMLFAFLTVLTFAVMVQNQWEKRSGS